VHIASGLNVARKLATDFFGQNHAFFDAEAVAPLRSALAANEQAAAAAVAEQAAAAREAAAKGEAPETDEDLFGDVREATASEATLQALGDEVARRCFPLAPRAPRRVQTMSSEGRRIMLAQAANAILAQLPPEYLGEVKPPNAAGGGDDGEGGGGGGGADEEEGEEGAGRAPPLRLLFEAQARQICTAALWREAKRRTSQQGEATPTPGSAAEAAGTAVAVGAGSPSKKKERERTKAAAAVATLRRGDGGGGRGGAPAAGEAAGSAGDAALVRDLLGEGIGEAVRQLPAEVAARLAALSGCELPPSLRRVAWRRVLCHPQERKRCTEALRRPDLADGEGTEASLNDVAVPYAPAAPRQPQQHPRWQRQQAQQQQQAAAAPGAAAAKLTGMVRQMVARGVASVPAASRAQLEQRAVALLLRSRAPAGGQLPAAFGPLSLAVLVGAWDEKEARDANATRDATAAALAAAKGTTAEPAAARAAAAAATEAAAAVDGAMAATLIALEARLAHDGVAAIKRAEGGVLALLQQKRWVHLQRHLFRVCGRRDINHGVELVAKRAVVDPGAPPPRAALLGLLEHEWVRPGFVGALPWAAALWAIDQCVLQGWGVLAEICAACLWLLRREVRRLDASAAGVAELREAMRAALRDISLAELQALLARPSRAAREGAGKLAKPHGPRVQYERGGGDDE